jgi:hypothetical protein
LSNNSGEVKKLSTYNFWPCLSILLGRSVTVAWVAVTSCVAHCWSFPYLHVISNSSEWYVPSHLMFHEEYN